MKNLLLALFLSTATLQAEDAPPPQDQFTALSGASFYPIYKALDFANDNGFRYVKILSYEFKGFGHTVICISENMNPTQGRFFQLHDEAINISFLCFEEAPSDPFVLDLEQYRDFLESVEETIADLLPQ